MICAIVLAAGRSERMGTQKLLLPLGGKPVIARIVDELRQCRLQKIIVVVGRDGEAVEHALNGRDVTFVTNPDPSGDMLSSVRSGLHATTIGCEAMLIVLGDQPNISSELASKLIERFPESGDGIVVPTHLGQRGHPLLIAARFRDELLSQHEGVGLRGLLAAHPEVVLRLELEDATVFADMDTPEDYQNQLARAKSS